MTAPTRAKGAASRATKGDRDQTKRDQTKRDQTKRTPKSEKSSTRTRTGTVERGGTRREERRDRSTGAGAERRPRTQRQSAEEPQRRRLVRPETRAKAKQLQTKVAGARGPLVIAVMSLLGIGLVSTLWLSIAAVSGTYELRKAEERTNQLNEQKELLVREVSNMDSTPALQRRAEKLGLVQGPDPAYLVQNPDGTIRMVGEPQKAKRPAPPPPPPEPQQQPGNHPPANQQQPGSPQPDTQRPADQRPVDERDAAAQRQAEHEPAAEVR